MRKVLDGAFVALLENLTFKIEQTIKSSGYNPEDFIVKAYPFAIERINKKPVPKKILKAIQKMLESK